MEKSETYGRILTELVNIYWAYDDHVIDAMLRIPGLEIKELVSKVDDLQIVIYTNDHNPPHFHVYTKDKKVDAKFRIDDGSLIKGNMSAKDLKKIKVFYNSPKTKMVLTKIWGKRA